MAGSENAEVIMFAGNEASASTTLLDDIKTYNLMSRYPAGFTLFTTPPLYDERTKNYVDVAALKNYVKGEKVKFSSIITESICGEVGLSYAGYAYGMVGSSTKQIVEAGCIPPSEPTLINGDGTLKQAVAEYVVSEVVKVIK
nr:MAG TPA: hypothetical protein [Caudoviricetes sp.]